MKPLSRRHMIALTASMAPAINEMIKNASKS